MTDEPITDEVVEPNEENGDVTEPVEPEPEIPFEGEEPEASTDDDDDDDENGDSEEPEPEPTPEAAQTDLAVEKSAKKLEAEVKRHTARIGEIMGEDANNLEPCPLCWELTPGWRWPNEPDEPVKAEVRKIIGLPALENYRPATDARECDDCQGLGQVLTGSKVIGKMQKQCSGCNGNGWKPIGAPGVHYLPNTPPPADETVYTDGASELPPTDPWGRTADDPLYGVMPGFVRTT